MKIVFIIPVYNDWDSLKVLSKQIKEISIQQDWRQVELIVVNDASTQELTTSPNPFALKSTILNLFSNQGSQRSISRLPRISNCRLPTGPGRPCSCTPCNIPWRISNCRLHDTQPSLVGNEDSTVESSRAQDSRD